MKRPSEKLQKEVLHSVFVTKYSMLIFMSGNNNSLVCMVYMYHCTWSSIIMTLKWDSITL